MKRGHLAREGTEGRVCRSLGSSGSLWYGRGSRDTAVAKTAQGRPCGGGQRVTEERTDTPDRRDTGGSGGRGE